MKSGITLIVNGKKCLVQVDPDELLVDVLRNQLGLTGTKKGCGTGDCGVCTVLMGGRTVNSCMVLAVAAEGKEILTVEGLERDGQLHPLQQSFIDSGAIQCGFCTPGMLISAKAILDAVPIPTRDEIRAGIAGNLCRCTGYEKIIDAVENAARASQEADHE